MTLFFTKIRHFTLFLQKIFFLQKFFPPGAPMINAVFCQYFFRSAPGNQRWLWGLFLCCCLTNCSDNKDKIIAEKVSERVTDFRNKKNEACRTALYANAEKIVDSLLLEDAQQALQDSLSRLRPFRPLQPPPVPAIDSLRVQPIFGDSQGQ